MDVDFFHAAGEGLPINFNRTRKFRHQWVDFWRFNHIKGVSGPRGSGSGLRVRFKGKLQPGQVEPVDLVLDPEFHPGRDGLTVGAIVATAKESRPAGTADPAKIPTKTIWEFVERGNRALLTRFRRGRWGIEESGGPLSV